MPGGTEKMVKQLLKSVREFKKDALLTPLFVVLEVVMEVLIPFVMAELIDKGIDAQNMSAIGKYGFILVACAMLALVFGAAARHLCCARFDRLCAQSQTRYVLCGAGLFVLQHRQVLHRLYRYPSDDGCHERAERISDVHAHRSAMPGHADLCFRHGRKDQQKHGAHLCCRAAGSRDRSGHC